MSVTAIIRRDPCWRCGTRGDLGCPHHEPDAPSYLRLRAFEPFHRPFDRSLEGQNL